VYATFSFLVTFVIPQSSMIYCYSIITLKIRRLSRVGPFKENMRVTHTRDDGHTITATTEPCEGIGSLEPGAPRLKAESSCPAAKQSQQHQLNKSEVRKSTATTETQRTENRMEHGRHPETGDTLTSGAAGMKDMNIVVIMIVMTGDDRICYITLVIGYIILTMTLVKHYINDIMKRL
jgi:hypothetical protein